uniref:Uncharacterized protein n=1 Tax=Globisporangium ultimum (strain ATCC 200006 / CBS 805.95 / DAOM BR144) TaxID=431595 RepID=K3X381_GLOUD
MGLPTPAVQCRKRKSTFTARKEEKALLLKKMQSLEAQIASLTKKSRQTSGDLVLEQVINNMALQQLIQSQQFNLAALDPAISTFLGGGQTNPLSLFIRLGSDWNARRQTLLSIKEPMLRNALEYIGVRSQEMDPLKHFLSEEQFETDQGDCCGTRFDIVQFVNVKSVKQVYDALLQYLFNIEINISEKLGFITVRDDYLTIENSVSNYRLLSTIHGAPVESNGVLLADYYDDHERDPCGVVAVDYIDDDTLYPYLPRERIRKDISTAFVLSPHWRQLPGGSTELVVVMKRAKFLKLHHAEFPIESAIIEQLHSGITAWWHVMVNAINDVLKTTSNAA